jgi:hypothetical protein
MRDTVRLTRFEALLDTDVCDARNNAELTIKLRMAFRQVNPAAGAAAGTYHDYGDATAPNRNIIAWDAASWALWKSNFVSSAERYWNGKFWLLNNRGIIAINPAGTIMIPNVYCKFDLIGFDAGSGTPHHTIDVVRLAATETWFGSHSTLYDSRDTELARKRVDSAGNPIMQRAHVHEVGHLLGMEHVDVGTAACNAAGDNNAGVCYGTSDRSMNDVMGAGMTLHEHHAAPWLVAMSAFLPRIPVTPIYTPPPARVSRFLPKMRRHYPRTTAEYEAGTLVTTR